MCIRDRAIRGGNLLGQIVHKGIGNGVQRCHGLLLVQADMKFTGDITGIGLIVGTGIGQLEHGANNSCLAADDVGLIPVILNRTVIFYSGQVGAALTVAPLFSATVTPETLAAVSLA